MTTAINEACIGWLHENCYLVREIFLIWEMRIFFFFFFFFCCWARFFPHLEGFPKTVGLEEGAGQSIPGGSNKQDEKR